ncbi:MAG: sulfatase-like hydrolase/transferase [Pirellulales bacterium]|nr:sulfatase-like hydrolase/transferase [Pirellulales bacterium]
MKKTSFAFLFVLFLLGTGSLAWADEPARRNIIFLLADDQRDNTLGAMGHPWVKTPNLDRLVNEGVRFSNTYTAEPVCSPSRTSLFTGMHERIHGIGFTSSYQLNDQQWELSYPALLRRHGYYTGFLGKIGIEYYTFRKHPEKKFDFWRGHNGWARFFHRTSPVCGAYRPYKEDIITPAMGECMEAFLDSLPKGKPFCLSVSFSVPHGSQTTSMYPDIPEGLSMMRPANENPKLKGHPIYGDLYRDLKIQIPADTATDPYRFIPKRIMDQYQGRADKVYDYDYHPTSCKEHHIRYYQQITGVDREVGQLIETLKQKGLWENTVIIYASDHGLLMGEYGMGGKALLYDLASKIPCFIHDPAMPQGVRGTTVDKLVSSLDLTKTILDYAGIDPPKEMTGKSLKRLIEQPDTPWRDELFLESLYTGRDTPFAEGIRRGDWKYIRLYDGVMHYHEKDLDFTGRTPDFEQLFNLKNDPAERVNLIADYEGTELLTTLRNKVAAYSQSLNAQRAAYQKTHKVTPRKVPKR